MYIYRYMYIYIYTYVSTQVNIYTCIHVYIYICIHRYTDSWIGRYVNSTDRYIDRQTKRQTEWGYGDNFTQHRDLCITPRKPEKLEASKPKPDSNIPELSKRTHMIHGYWVDF